ncbi:hypothetical protein E4U54_006091 [Claviceps lovelessii]|nr:hypothetical protein E4U54_006091 [Claviceps lovelessii]
MALIKAAGAAGWGSARDTPSLYPSKTSHAGVEGGDQTRCTCQWVLIYFGRDRPTEAKPEDRE